MAMQETELGEKKVTFRIVPIDELVPEVPVDPVIRDPQINDEYHAVGTKPSFGVLFNNDTFDIFETVRSMLPREPDDDRYIDIIPYKDDLVDYSGTVAACAIIVGQTRDAIDRDTGKVTMKKGDARVMAQLGIPFDTSRVKYDLMGQQKPDLSGQEPEEQPSFEDDQRYFHPLHESARLAPDLPGANGNGKAHIVPVQIIYERQSNVTTTAAP